MSGRITALEPQQHSRERVNVYLDGEFAFGLALSAALALRIGDTLTEADIAALRAADEVEKAREKALNYLSYRPRSEAEVRRYLEEREFSFQSIDEVIERLCQVGLIDDNAFASFWVENRNRFRPRGERALAQELRQHGIAPEVIESALSDYDAAAAGDAYAREQARRLAAYPPEQFRRRLAERLARRGFSYDLIQDLLARYASPDSINLETEE
ncbi:MAG: RecX family transcriptional regulator [Anaerolineae bacterium]|nr:RecX family transcriptional regulator [Anaerolineae bacterium]